jgi:6-phosphogluconolactonase (cycloisomerase 2 family)
MTWSKKFIVTVAVVILLFWGGVVVVTVSVFQHRRTPEARGPSIERDHAGQAVEQSRHDVAEARVSSGKLEQPSPGPTTTVPFGTLQYRGAVTREDLRSVCSVVVSSDGRHLYAAAFEVNTIVTFRRDPDTGAIEHLESTRDDANLSGVTCLELSPDGRHAVTAAFRTGGVALFARDASSGKLELLDVLNKRDPDAMGLNYTTRAEFSKDGKHIFALDSQEGGVTVLAVGESGELRWLHTNPGEAGSLAGSRGLAVFPDGKTLALANHLANTLALLDWDSATEETRLRLVVRDEEDGAHTLAGVFGVACSADGKSVYACSGRFRGDHAISAYQVTETGELALLQEFVGAAELNQFQGGNRIMVSPDGRNVYATATVSGSLACFERNPTDGRLRHIETLTDDPTRGDLKGAAGICCSPDGRFVYVAAEFEKTIALYKRLGAK